MLVFVILYCLAGALSPRHAYRLPSQPSMTSSERSLSQEGPTPARRGPVEVRPRRMAP